MYTQKKMSVPSSSPLERNASRSSGARRSVTLKPGECIVVAVFTVVGAFAAADALASAAADTRDQLATVSRVATLGTEVYFSFGVLRVRLPLPACASLIGGLGGRLGGGAPRGGVELRKHNMQ